VTATYRMRPALVAALLAGAVVAAALAATQDTPGRLLLGALALVTTAEGVRGLRPALTADDDGITVATLTGRAHHPWSHVVAVAPLAPPSSGRRLRRSTNALEVDLGERLLVVPGYRLGTGIDEVVSTLRRLARSRSVC